MNTANNAQLLIPFMVVSSRLSGSQFPIQEMLFDLLALAILGTSLFLLISLSKSELRETELAIRGSLNLAQQRMTATLENRLAFDLRSIVCLAARAETLPRAAMQASIEQAR